MLKGIAKVAAAPIRASHTDRSEMVNQLLIGECAEILRIKDSWVHLKKCSDQYEGWVNRNELFIPDNEEEVVDLEEFFASCEIFCHAPMNVYAVKTKQQIVHLLPGAYIVKKQIEDKIIYDFPFGKYVIETPLKSFKQTNHLDTAKQFLGTPYLWGGLSANGIDCSGLTQIVARLHDKVLQRDASQQAKLGEILHSPLELHQVNAGDLLFFNPGEKKTISHVGFYLGSGLMLHASGSVKINAILPEKASYLFPYEKKYGESLCAWRSWN